VVKKQDEPEAGGEGWLISYCDMISLLVTFFLMMMTFSTKETGDVADVGVGIMKGKGGVWPKLMGLSSSPALDPDEIRDMAADLDAAGRDESGAPALAMVEALDGLSLRFDDRCAFARGSAVLPLPLAENLRRLGEMLARHPVDCVVEGYGDDDFEATTTYATNEVLGSTRALTAAKALLQIPGVDPSRVSIAAFGSERKRDPRNGEQAGDKNRRVEVRLLAITGMRVSEDPNRPRGR
jgi:chemotaxis protein MotB